MTTRRTPSSDRVAMVVTLGAIVATAALVPVMVVMAHDDAARDAAAGQRTASALTNNTPLQQKTPQRDQRPSGEQQVLAAADNILTAYNERESAPLRARACDRTPVTDDLFAGFSETVSFARDGMPTIVGFTAEVPFVVSDDSRQRTGAMRLRWDGNRWCFVTAVAEPG